MLQPENCLRHRRTWSLYPVMSAHTHARLWLQREQGCILAPPFAPALLPFYIQIRRVWCPWVRLGEPVLCWFVFLRGSSSLWLDPAFLVSALISKARLSLIRPVACQSPGLNWQLICMLLSSRLLFVGWESNATRSYCDASFDCTGGAS